MWSLVQSHGGLDLNSPYAYLVLGHDFRDTSAVAEAGDGALAGFVLGYRPPARSSSLFVWQVGVAPTHRGQGLAGRMISSIIERHPAELRYVEATVTPDNVASRRLFQGIARRLGAACTVMPDLAADDFPAGSDGHDPEDRFVIGPLPPEALTRS